MLQFAARTRIGAIDLDVELTVESRGPLALVGPSGAGKSSILRLIAGLLTPDAGRVACGGEVWLDTGGSIALPPERRRAGYLFQEYALFPRMTALGNVAFGLAHLGRHERRSVALSYLDRFGLTDRAAEKPERLSGGERQRVALARALAGRPRVLLLDEPLSALDAGTRNRAAQELVNAVAELEVPVVLVTHDFAEAALLADRIAVLDRGRVVRVGSARDLVADPRSVAVAELTGALVLRGRVLGRDGGLTTVELEGGARVVSPDPGAGAVAVLVAPWEIEIEIAPPAAGSHRGSAQNAVGAEIATITELRGRARVALAGDDPIVAELTPASVERLGLVPGQTVTASWKAVTTRILELDR